MKCVLSILVVIGNLNVLLANNDNCRENDLNALMVRLRQLRKEFADLKIQHDELRPEIATIKGTVTARGRVVFDTVITNQGEGYNISTGIFTSPYTGLYFFSVQLCKERNNVTYYDIRQEDILLTKSTEYDDNGAYSCSSVSTIAMVNKTEKVWVHSYSEFYNDYYGWNTFSGSLLNK
ncbi:complement C1q subcomponent subunit A-like isoform X2 [Ruditapes philippinarum]|uniref:complement C1q subcomponent subunit A-like isoform X2 n=1 Tax=Ruditapes philippinarum TaxID=129788 RepID=UPI00295B2119|nr:complement C1q subcomponent subunit A-like isoform X2 [Ruditapes philippinarum]